MGKLWLFAFILIFVLGFFIPVSDAGTNDVWKKCPDPDNPTASLKVKYCDKTTIGSQDYYCIASGWETAKCPDRIQNDKCEHSGACSDTTGLCTYTAGEYCPQPGTCSELAGTTSVTCAAGKKCYYGTRSCSGATCGLSTCNLAASQRCDATSGCVTGKFISCTADPSSVKADGSEKSKIKAESKDGATLVGSKQITFSSDRTDDTFTSSGTCTTAASGADLGKCDVEVSSKLAGTANIDCKSSDPTFSDGKSSVTFTGFSINPISSLTIQIPSSGTTSQTRPVSVTAHAGVIGDITLSPLQWKAEGASTFGATAPSGLSASLSDSTLSFVQASNAYETATLTVTVGSAATATTGTGHTLRVAGTSGNLISSKDVTISVTSQAPPPTQLPDLIVHSTAYSPLDPTVGSAMSFSGKVKNQGSDSATASKTRLSIDVNNDNTWQDITPDKDTSALATNAEADVSWASAWTAVAGTHKFKICADATSIVAESNNNNNCAARIFSTGCVKDGPCFTKDATCCSGEKLYKCQ